MDGKLNWYDSLWLGRYLSAKAVIAKVAPGKLAEFMSAFDLLRTDPGYVVKDVPGVFRAEQLEEIRSILESIPLQKLEVHEVKSFGRFVVHDHPVFTRMQAELTERVSSLVGEELEPNYNFLSMYTRLGVCDPHLDAPSAKWTLDVCIDQSQPWPIHFSQIVPWPEEPPDFCGDWKSQIKNSPDLEFSTKELMPGDGIVFSGSSQWHYRNPLPPQAGVKPFCNLLFFHFIPRGSREILFPGNWARLFDVPELALIPGIDKEL